MLSFIRCKSTGKVASTIGKTIHNKEELRQLLSKPTWSFNDIINNDIDEPEITADLVKHMGKLSGLEITDTEGAIKSLKSQMSFIKALYSDNEDAQNKQNNNVMFRLMESDNEPKPITLTQLMESIENLPKEVDSEKGEVHQESNKIDFTGKYITIKK